jgi:hypothetical protein
VRIAKADLVPTEANLLDAYPDMASLVAACDAFCAQVNGRRHRETGAVPAERLAVERERLHVLPSAPYAAALGETRLVNTDQTVRFGSVRYSTPPGLVSAEVWVRSAPRGGSISRRSTSANPRTTRANLDRHRAPATTSATSSPSRPATPTGKPAASASSGAPSPSPCWPPPNTPLRRQAPPKTSLRRPPLRRPAPPKTPLSPPAPPQERPPHEPDPPKPGRESRT